MRIPETSISETRSRTIVHYFNFSIRDFLILLVTISSSQTNRLCSQILDNKIINLLFQLLEFTPSDFKNSRSPNFKFKISTFRDEFMISTSCIHDFLFLDSWFQLTELIISKELPEFMI